MIRRVRGAMLIDVLASLVILGGTVVTLLLAQSQAVEQAVTALRMSTASHLASELIVAWKLGYTDVCTPDAGIFANEENWSWRRSVDRMVMDHDIQMFRVTLDIARRENHGTDEIVRTYQWLEQIDDEWPN